jgi:hypothetical protein
MSQYKVGSSPKSLIYVVSLFFPLDLLYLKVSIYVVGLYFP